jgi:hypothetical protein
MRRQDRRGDPRQTEGGRPKRLSAVALAIAVAAPLAGLGLLAAVAWSPAPAQARSFDAARHAVPALVSAEESGRRGP